MEQSVRYWAEVLATAPPWRPREREAGPRRRMRIWIWEAQGHLCAICGERITKLAMAGQLWRWQPTVDHCIPRSHGGFDGLGNMVCSHNGCNNDKGDRMPTGCELIWLLAVNARLGVQPQRW